MKKKILISAILAFSMNASYAGANESDLSVADMLGLQPSVGTQMVGEDQETIKERAASKDSAVKEFKRNPKNVPEVVIDKNELIKKEIMKNLGLDEEKVAPTKVKTENSISIENGPIVDVRIGDSKVMTVAIGMLNRIQTPFNKVQVKTANSGVITTSNGMIFVAPESDAPIGLMVWETGYPESMFNLTLLPKDVPPKMYDMNVKMTDTQQIKWEKFSADTVESEKRAALEKEWAKAEKTNRNTDDDSYEGKLLKTLKTIASQGIPNGFQEYAESSIYMCDASKNKGSFPAHIKQVLDGSRLKISVGYVKNNTSEMFEIVESQCYKEGVVAVSVYPTPYLKPGQQAEIYIVAEKQKAKPERQRQRVY